MRLAVRPMIIEDLAEKLARGDVELVVTTAEFAAPDLPSRHLYRDSYVGLMRARHPLAGHRVSIDAFCCFDHVIVSPTRGALHGSTDDALRRIGRRRNVRYAVPTFLAVPDLLQTDDLIAVVSQVYRVGSRRGPGFE